MTTQMAKDAWGIAEKNSTQKLAEKAEAAANKSDSIMYAANIMGTVELRIEGETMSIHVPLTIEKAVKLRDSLTTSIRYAKTFRDNK